MDFRILSLYGCVYLLVAFLIWKFLLAYPSIKRILLDKFQKRNALMERYQSVTMGRSTTKRGGISGAQFALGVLGLVAGVIGYLAVPIEYKTVSLTGIGLSAIIVIVLVEWGSDWFRNQWIPIIIVIAERLLQNSRSDHPESIIDVFRSMLQENHLPDGAIQEALRDIVNKHHAGAKVNGSTFAPLMMLDTPHIHELVNILGISQWSLGPLAAVQLTSYIGRIQGDWGKLSRQQASVVRFRPVLTALHYLLLGLIISVAGLGFYHILDQGISVFIPFTPWMILLAVAIEAVAMVLLFNMITNRRFRRFVTTGAMVVVVMLVFGVVFGEPAVRAMPEDPTPTYTPPAPPVVTRTNTGTPPRPPQFTPGPTSTPPSLPVTQSSTPPVIILSPTATDWFVPPTNTLSPTQPPPPQATSTRSASATPSSTPPVVPPTNTPDPTNTPQPSDTPEPPSPTPPLIPPTSTPPFSPGG